MLEIAQPAGPEAMHHRGTEDTEKTIERLLGVLCASVVHSVPRTNSACTGCPLPSSVTPNRPKQRGTLPVCHFFSGMVQNRVALWGQTSRSVRATSRTD